MQIREQNDLGKNLLLYGLGLLLLLEWLYPLSYVTNTGYISLFVIITIGFFVITYLQIKLWLSFILKSFLIAYGLHVMFFEEKFLTSLWISHFLGDLFHNIALMFTGQFSALTDLFRSLIFFMLLAVLAYLVYYWTIQLKRVILFFTFTIVYITVIDTFTLYNANFAIIRAFFVGFLLLGLVTMYRKVERSKAENKSHSLPTKLVSSLLILIMLSASVGFAAPKYEPQWNDPVPFVKNSLGMGSGLKTIGYGTNDEQLGGGFIIDDTPVFYADVPRGHYWRGESRDFYTGKGWETTTPDIMKFQHSNLFYQFENRTVTAKIEMADAQSFEHAFYPGELKNVESDGYYEVDAFTGKAETFSNNGRTQILSDYTVEFSYPIMTSEELREIQNPNDIGLYPEEVATFYLQTPETLPDRVRELTVGIVEEYDNQYDQVRAVERYFRLAGFTYETIDVPVPEEGQDYVDQFLFETMQGYCDNFSTAMVVMLRTVGIPARWVKGFTQGERIEDEESDIPRYVISNSNAHSWVEVYFPNYGWIPFEPTQGFSYPVNLFNTGDINDMYYDMYNMEEYYRQQQAQETLAPIEEDVAPVTTTNRNFQIPIVEILLAIGGIGVVILVSWAVFLNRKRLLAVYYFLIFNKRKDEQAFGDAYDRLLWLLKKAGVAKREEETIREFAHRIDKQYAMQHMTTLTRNYERINYGNGPAVLLWNENKQIWQTIIKKIVS
ncbi:transglutaminase TgpA family protein [Bacillus alkalicellulosilyticus]|uniref:transglutaminase TgpA family protein n=1 Tax=Alkalihalobacterium alkalicellulosilyticum TaxID=1912214 RepID=UPI0009973074|nr:transglutaminaseTgpA domain-containing protein [Bacillus alkalicellulosilyticus]